ncbi:telomere repeats-binding bouquet formation protein 1 [Mustelus asterias]
MARLRKIAEHCDFGTALNDMLRDCLVHGVNDEAIQRRLLAEAEVNFIKALEIALMMENAEKGTQELQNKQNGTVQQLGREAAGSSGANNEKQIQKLVELEDSGELIKSLGLCHRHDNICIIFSIAVQRLRSYTYRDENKFHYYYYQRCDLTLLPFVLWLKTDLNLLLECLKYQMDSPVTQKQALITIHSICQQNSEASDYFREIGGLQFVNGLIKLSDAPILREAALFTLGALAESSVYCQQSLCTAELLSDVALSLAQKDASLILKRMNVYVILVLVSQNKFGQALMRTTGCIDVLLNLFRTSFPISDKQSIHENIGQCYELWSSIGSTLCACVNNPQNEENQRLCTAAFPFAKDCLQKCIKQEVIRPICAFIGLAVANNSYAQDHFCKVGGLDALAQVLVRLVDESIRHHSRTKLAVAVIKTLDSCISENPPAASCLSEYLIVPKLLALLIQNGLDISSKLGIILAIGHCTDGCEAHQYQLLQSNGLPLMIQIVAEAQDEEQRKAATFVLQSCQPITEKLSNSLVEDVQPRRDTFTTSDIPNQKDNSLNNFWKFAEQFLNRIKALEKQQEQEKVRRQIFVEDGFPQEANRKISNAQQFGNVDKWSSDAKTRDMKSQQYDLSIDPAGSNGPSASSDIKNRDRVPETDQQYGAKFWSVQCGKPFNQPVTVPVAELPRPSTSRKEQKSSNEQDFTNSHDSFKRPAPIIRKRSKQNYIDPLILCSDLIDNEITISLTNPAPSFTAGQDFRCSGCSTTSTSLNSRNFCKILQLCPNKCDRHKVIQECEDRYKKELKKLLTCYSTVHDKKILLTPIEKTASRVTNFYRQHTDFLTGPKPSTKDVHEKKILLTPVQKPVSLMTNFHRQQTDFIPWSKPSTKDGHRENQKHLADERKDLCTPQACNQSTFRDHIYSFDDNKHSDICKYASRTKQKTKRRRRRKNFTEKEVSYLVEGVKKMGYHWNSILWSYPFQKGRTNVDLAHKYRMLQKGNSTK